MTPCTAVRQASLSLTISQSLLKIMSIELVMLSNFSSSSTLFSFCLQSFPTSRSFLMSHLFASDGQSIGASALALVLPMEIQTLFLLGLTSLMSLKSKWPSRVFSSTTIWKHQTFMVQFSHPYRTTGKTIALTMRTFVSKVMSLLFNMLSRFAITFLPRSKYLLISWLQSLSSVILDPRKTKSVPASTLSPSICHEVMGSDAMILVFWMLRFKGTFSISCLS